MGTATSSEANGNGMVRDVVFHDLDEVPAELKEQERWVTWRWRKDAEGRWQKVPTDPRTGHDMNDKDPANWMGFDEAMRLAKGGSLDVSGVGFCFSEHDPYCGVDLDDCRNPATGAIQGWAWEIVRALDSYTEVSPSGTGVKIYCRGALQRSGKRGSVEMYDRRRYFTVTGKRVEGTPQAIRSAQKELLELNRRTFGDTDGDAGGDIPDPMSPELDDSEVLEKLRSGKGAEKFGRLFDDGDLSDHDGDHSGADLALCGMLAFYTQDPVQLDRLFRRSGLMRAKWDERHRGDGANYGEMTIEKVLVGRRPEDCWRGKEEAPREGLLEKRLLVGKAITEGIEPPAALIDGVLYAGKIHAWHGEPGTGKSILALWAAREVVRGGRSVLYLDEEGSLDAVSERMEGLGADPEGLDERFYYVQSPGITLEKGSLDDLREAAREVMPALVVFDSWADFLALEGLNENDSVDVTKWVLNVAYPLRDLGATVLLLDHLNKEAKGKGGRGSTAKFAKLDAGHKLLKVEDFDRNHVGTVRFVREKDRLAALDPRIVFRVGGNGEGKIVCRMEGDVTVVTDEGLTLNERTALDALEDGGLTYTEWKKAAGQPASSFQKSKAGLMEKRLVRQGTDKRYYPTREGGDSPTHPDSPSTHGAHVSHAGGEPPPQPTTHSDSGALGPESVSQGGDPREQAPMGPTLLERPRPVLVTPERVPALVEEIKAAEAVALDLETTGLDPQRDRIRVLSLATGRGAWVLDVSDTDPAPVLEVLKEKTLIIHNAAFDLGFLGQRGYEYTGEVIDTMLLSQLIYAGANVAPLRKGRTTHALDSVAERELGVALDKGLQTADWAGELTEDMVEYAARDAEVLIPLHRKLMEKIEKAGLSRVLEIERRAQRTVLWMARSGLPFDETRWLELAEEAKREAARLDERLQEMAPPHPEGKEWNWNSPQQVKQALAMLGLPVEDTRDETLARLDHPFVRLLREYRKKNGVAVRHGEKWLLYKDGSRRVTNGRIYPAWKQIGAATGRMSCAEPNLQAIPHGSGHHSCIKAPEGRVLVKADYSQIELRLAAKMWGEPVMLETFREGGDVHEATARSITGKGEVTRAERKLAKAVNFGLIFGQGANGLKGYARDNYGVEMTPEEATAYRRRFFETYQGIARWHEKNSARINRGEFDTRTLAGRRRRDVRSYTEHLNAPVQGTAADGMKMALALLWERRDECPGAVPILAVHDEIVFECDADRAEQTREWLLRAMKEGMDAVVNAEEPQVPIEVEASVSQTWG